ncbi:MAG: glycosyltransferase [Kiritimatiellae bacterium]|nr:glycosyltransferase [Kiritimatiellia bacterium]
MKISFLVPSYNHEKYVSGFIQSVLAQTNPNWEMIIVDDCSVDRNVEIIKTYSDARIKFVQTPFNSGINAALNLAYKYSSGEIISTIAADDELEPEYTEKVIAAFTAYADVGVVYTPLAVIDGNGRKTGKIFKPDYSVAVSDYFRSLFLKQVFLQSPGMAYRRVFAEKIHPLPLGLLQFQDVGMHLALSKYTRPLHLDSPVVRYRVAGQGVSNVNAVQLSQQVAETPLLMDLGEKLIGDDVVLFKKLFHNVDWVKDADIRQDLIPYYLAKIAMTSAIDARRAWGMARINRLISEDDLLGKINAAYGMKFADLYAELRSCAPVRFTTIEKRRMLVPGVYKISNGKSRSLSICGLRIMYKSK